MGTNYYLHNKPDCKCCGRSFEPLHIGTSSYGWCFALYVNPALGINTLDDWRNLWLAPGSYIRDEYGERLSVAEMEHTITARCIYRAWDDEWWYGLYRSEAEFHERNHSERGPNGLLRHKIGKLCTAHGEGTWDYIEGDFS